MYPGLAHQKLKQSTVAVTPSESQSLSQDVKKTFLNIYQDVKKTFLP